MQKRSRELWGGAAGTGTWSGGQGVGSTRREEQGAGLSSSPRAALQNEQMPMALNDDVRTKGNRVSQVPPTRMGGRWMGEGISGNPELLWLTAGSPLA